MTRLAGVRVRRPGRPSHLAAARRVAVAVAVAVAALTVAGAVAAPPASAAVLVPTDGIDVSYPQAGQDLPEAPAGLAIVGLNSGTNDGTDATRNPDLARQLAWASAVPRVDVYVNSQHPDPAAARWWPTGARARDGSRVPARYGRCTASAPASAACAYVYGWSVANGDLATPLDGVVPGRWWIDVEGVLGGRGGEHGNDWSRSRTRNRAVLEGMAVRFVAAHRRVGLYAAPGQFADVVGAVPAASPLAPLPSWLALAGSERAARRLCTRVPLTAGRVALAQWKTGPVTVGFDRDVVCAAFRSAPGPRITGSRRVRGTVSAVPGRWSDAPRLTYRWTRDGAPIAGATGRRYRLAAKDAGHLLRVRVTATRDGWSRTERTSGPVRVHR